MFSLRRAPLAACALALASAASVAAPPPLTLAQAQQRAVERSQQLLAQQHSAAAARDMAVAAAQLPDPVLKAGVDNLPASGADRFRLGADFMTMRRIGLMQEFTSSDKRRWRAERFEREAERIRATADVQTAAIQRDTALAWLDRYYLERMADELARQIAQANDEIAAAEAAYRGGRGSQAGLIDARAALLALQDRASEQALRVRNAGIMLERWSGQPAEAPLAGVPDTSVLALDPAALESQLAHHPQIAVFNKQAEVAQAQARLAQANRSPDWSVEFAVQQRGSGNPSMLSFGVSVPLQWDRQRRQDREVAARQAEAEQAAAEREEALRGHVAEVRAQVAEWHSVRQRLARYQREIVPLSAERSAALLAAYRGGKASLAEVLAARRMESEQRLQAWQLEREGARLWAQLSFFAPVNVKEHP